MAWGTSAWVGVAWRASIIKWVNSVINPKGEAWGWMRDLMVCDGNAGWVGICRRGFEQGGP